jgi:hypothetical protein
MKDFEHSMKSDHTLFFGSKGAKARSNAGAAHRSLRVRTTISQNRKLLADAGAVQKARMDARVDV